MSERPLLSGAVTSEDTRASRIGTSMLARGGSAADAMVAATLAINVLDPHRADIGGGGFALVRRPDGEYEALDFRQCAPVRPLAFISHSEEDVRAETARARSDRGVLPEPLDEPGGRVRRCAGADAGAGGDTSAVGQAAVAGRGGARAEARG